MSNETSEMWFIDNHNEFLLQVLGANENFEIYCIIDTTFNRFEIYGIIDTTLNPFEIYCILDTTLNCFGIFWSIFLNLASFHGTFIW